MRKVFTSGEGFLVPDGTIVHSVLDPAALAHHTGQYLEEISIALGHIQPQTLSKIHLHPVVTQVTWALSGALAVKMKDDRSDTPYTLEVLPEQAILTRPGTFFQLINRSDCICRVLYIVSPAFIFEAAAGGEVLYNDALVLDHDWDDLAAMDWTLPELDDLETFRRAREESLGRLRSGPKA